MKKNTLLLVDDMKLFLHLGRSLLSGDDFVVYTTSSGLEALEIARRSLPDAILLDLHMPDMDGDEVCRNLRSDPTTNHIPVIMVTAGSDGGDRSRCMRAGCDDFITKPVRAGLLKKAVEKQLNSRPRTYPRAQVVIPCLLDSGLELLKTNIFTLSAGGAYVEMDPPPLPDSAHKLSFTLPEERETITVRTLARWNRVNLGERPAGSGFEFVDVGEGTFDRLNLWVEKELDDPIFP